MANGSAQAQTVDLYTVTDIAVDATAENAVAARSQAHKQGQRDGLARLLKRLVPASDQSLIPPAASLQAERYVQNFEIAGEQLSNTRYLARMTIAFDSERVKELLQAERLPFSEKVSQPVLVLPLFKAPDGAKLWPEGNPWWAAFAKTLEAERPLRLIMPLGDLEDVGAMSIEQAENGDQLALQRLANRYGAKDGIVASAELLSDPSGDGPVSVRLGAERVGSLSRSGQPFTLNGAPGEPLASVLENAVVRLQDSLDEQWKSQHILRLDTGGLIFVDIPIESLTDWVDISRNLENLPVVSQVEIAAFAQTLVKAQIYYVGDEVGFERALDGLGLTLSREEESWLLLPTAAIPRVNEPLNETSTSF
ncbi:MAG: DUF2066 domain-containing protein [Alphaproteobacteria bacterium]|nr:DUF2066 domain-containing protein [Alphaproteobacteria bacterium]